MAGTAERVLDPEGLGVNKRLDFYRRTVSRWIPDRSASILVVAGGENDREVLRGLGFANVVVSNLKYEGPGAGLDPFGWSEQNAESLTYDDGAFEYVVVHAGLHHCRSPHRGLLEMYRVARKAVVAFEPPDNLLTRAMQRLGLAQEYEYTAVRCQGGEAGGVNDSDVPNYVYRWSEREVRKTVSSYAPEARHRIRFAHGTDAPTPQFVGRSLFLRLLLGAAMPAYRLLTGVLPRQRNLFGFCIEKPDLFRDGHSWLVVDGDRVRFDPRWVT